MSLSKIFFPNSLLKFNESILLFLFSILLFSSCSSSKSASLAYMDDIYYNSYEVNAQLAKVEQEEDDEGLPPENVPGAAYVYQPIPEPEIDAPVGLNNPALYSSMIYNNPLDYFPGDYYYSPYNSYPYGYSYPYYGGGFMNFGFFFSTSFPFNGGFPPIYNSPYGSAGSGYYCPSNSYSQATIGGSSTAFVAKRFSWNTEPEQGIYYINKTSNSENNNVRSRNSRKATYVNSSATDSKTDSESKSNNKFRSFINAVTTPTSTNSSDSGSDYNSGSRSSHSSSGSRSSGSSSGSRSSSGGSSYTGKRIR
jgi:uncharacterized membrane protein YgcG